MQSKLLRALTAVALNPLVIFLLVLFGDVSMSAAQDGLEAPDSLMQWAPWVRERHPELACGNIRVSRPCIWPGRLELSIGDKEGSFRFFVRMDRRGLAPLPGSSTNWPQDVRLLEPQRDLPVVVLQKDRLPYAKLEAGDYLITGTFKWALLPERLQLPVESGLVNVTVRGESVPFPSIDDSGVLWLQKEQQTEDVVEADRVQVLVFRKLTDGVPFRYTTRLNLRISGKAREINLGPVIFPDSVALRIASSLPYRLDQDSNFIVQAKSGEHAFIVEAVFRKPPERLKPLSAAVEGWPPQEIWVWEPNELIRSVELSGAPAVDPQRTALPAKWKAFAGYALAPEDELVFKETRRGQSKPPPNVLNLSRTFWLDLEGAGFTIRDSITGTMFDGWRLNSLPEMSLGHVKVNGVDQVITKDVASGLSGVEVRSQEIAVIADSRLAPEQYEFAATGWGHDVTGLNVNLMLPPGWTLLWTKGVDLAQGTWISGWTLLDLFLLMLLTVAIGKLFGVAWAAVALVALTVCHDQAAAPFQIWFYLLILHALLRVLQPGKPRTIAAGLYLFILFYLLLELIPFSLTQLRAGFYPQLGAPTGYYQEAVFEGNLLLWFLGGFFAFLEAGGGAVLLLALGAAFVACLVLRKWKLLGLAAGGVVLVLVLMNVSRQSMIFGGGYMEKSASAPRVRGPASAPAPQRLEQSAELAIDSADELEPLSDGEGAANMAVLESRTQAARKELLQVDPSAVVQTGPGIPSWSWRSWYLSWNGPVVASHRMKLVLAGPTLNLFLSVLRVLLTVALAFLFISYGRREFGNPLRFAVFLLLLYPSLPQPADAQTFPSESLLRELETRLIERECKENCTSVSRLSLTTKDYALEAHAVVSSDGPGAWSLPGPFTEFMPSSVEIDGRPASALRRDDAGLLWVRVPAGTHQVHVKGELRKRDTITLQFGLNPGYFEMNAGEWTVDGVTESGSVEGSVQLIRNQPLRKEQGEREVELGQWFSVKREITVGIPWSVTTTVERLGATERSLLAKIPLLKGEAVVTDGIKVENGIATIAFARGASEVTWTSDYEVQPEITLAGEENYPTSETWLLACTSVWRCEYSGVPPVSTIREGQYEVVWKPWPGEKVTVKVTKPLGVPGQYLTIDRATLNYRPGVRMLEGMVFLAIRASQGEWLRLTLPPGVEVEQVTYDGAPKTIRPENNELRLPITPGSQEYTINWRAPWSYSVLSPIERLPEVKVSAPLANAEVSYDVPPLRWILLVRGPAWGPAVLFWPKLLIMLVIAYLLSRYVQTPLRFRDWALLGLGLSSVEAGWAMVPVIWFVALNWRKTKGSELRPGVFNAVQVLLILLTVLAASVFFMAVQAGLILYPDMQVAGGGSNNSYLHWYDDYVSGAFPAISVLTLPIWVWRVLMLLWATWLAVRLLAWVRWGWECFSGGGYWQKRSAPVS